MLARVALADGEPIELEKSFEQPAASPPLVPTPAPSDPPALLALPENKIKPQSSPRRAVPDGGVCALVAITESTNSERALNWVLADPAGFGTVSILLVHTSKRKDKDAGERLLSSFADRCRPFNRVSVETKWLETDRHGVGHTIKIYCKEEGPHLLVAGYSDKQLELMQYFTTADTWCPVLLVKSSLEASPSKPSPRFATVGAAQDNSKHSELAFKWLLSRLSIPKKSQFVVCHVVLAQDDKPKGREFLAAFKPLCEGRPYIIRSALIYAKREKTVSGGLKSFCEMKEQSVELMVLAPKPERGAKSKTRVGGAITLECIENMPCDVLVYKDEQTQTAEGQHGYVARLAAPFVKRASIKWLSIRELGQG